MTDDERTPVVVLPAHRPLVMALHNHAAVLEQTRGRLILLRDDIAAASVPVAPSSLAELGKASRAEADSATDLARVAERLAEAK